MLTLRVGIRRHFRARASEWQMALMTFIWGAVLAQPAMTFNLSPSFHLMARMASESTWSAFALTVGGLRIIALVINGTYKGKWYSRISPHVRGVCALLNCCIWASISVGILGSGEASTGLATYPLLLAFDFYNIAHAFEDAGKTDRACKNGGP